MNWRFTRPRVEVSFEKDEPICMLTPQPRGLLETVTPTIRDIRRYPDLMAEYAGWSEDRSKFLAQLRLSRPKNANKGWQKDYFRGIERSGENVPEHQVKIDLREFVEEQVKVPPPKITHGLSRATSAEVLPRRGGAFLKAGRNDPCPCGSGKKYKKCCMAKT
jgi:hypothetical protein